MSEVILQLIEGRLLTRYGKACLFTIGFAIGGLISL